ncbi:hypothetical protein MIR68_010001 [Amoeboaphelidium protococcarum]|nr:hypothetical protein MIR68_010001 [Amoeboaphelidium protococcarum]
MSRIYAFGIVADSIINGALYSLAKLRLSICGLNSCHSMYTWISSITMHPSQSVPTRQVISEWYVPYSKCSTATKINDGYTLEISCKSVAQLVTAVNPNYLALSDASFSNAIVGVTTRTDLLGINLYNAKQMNDLPLPVGQTVNVFQLLIARSMVYT